jgi:hypothetical protein
MVAHTCNPSYLENRDQKDHSFRPVWVKSEQDKACLLDKAGHGCASLNSSSTGGIGRMIVVWGWPYVKGRRPK